MKRVKEKGTELAVVEGEGKLPARQKRALELLRTGMSMTEAAESAAVDRKTLYRWIKSNPIFAAAYHRWLNEQEETGRGRLAAAVDRAAALVVQAVDNGDVRTAMELLKNLGTLRPLERRSTDPTEIERRRALAETKRVNKLEADERNVDINDRLKRASDQDDLNKIKAYKVRKPADINEFSFTVKHDEKAEEGGNSEF
jgi:hypothetical protein